MTNPIESAQAHVTKCATKSTTSQSRAGVAIIKELLKMLDERGDYANIRQQLRDAESEIIEADRILVVAGVPQWSPDGHGGACSLTFLDRLRLVANHKIDIDALRSSDEEQTKEEVA